MQAMKRISIVGAGISGLTTAIALRQRGFEVTVFEQASTLGEIGAGVQFSPNAMKVVKALGLEEGFMAIAFEPNRHVVKNWKTGSITSATQMVNDYRQKYGAGYFGVHRADLHALLVGALPAGTVELNARCVGAKTEGQLAVLTLADGRTISSDLIIGADGIHSAVRESLFGPESPRYTGNICWRGLVPAAALPKNLIEPDMTVWFGPNANVVHYYVRGGELVNWVASHDATGWRSESWKIEADPDEVLRTYKDWHPALRELFSSTESCYKWALYDRDPLQAWSKGSVTLVGDAAHAMLPYLAQGACMAVEDAYIIADCLAKYSDDTGKALQQYEYLRKPRTSRVQLAARERAQINNLVSPWARLRRDFVYALRKTLAPKTHTYRIEWIYEYDVQAQL